jgi:hypothetical protein
MNFSVKRDRPREIKPMLVERISSKLLVTGKDGIARYVAKVARDGEWLESNDEHPPFKGSMSRCLGLSERIMRYAMRNGIDTKIQIESTRLEVRLYQHKKNICSVKFGKRKAITKGVSVENLMASER